MKNNRQSASTAIGTDVLCAQDYESQALRCMPAATFAYVAGGSGHDRTARGNRAAFTDWDIVPRSLRDLGQGHTRLTLGGAALAHPIALAPVAFQQLAHAQGERASAAAAEATDSLFVASTLSSCSLEEIAAATRAPKWFQLYLQPHRSDSLELLRRAEAAGYQAVVLTLDASIQMPSLQAARAGFRMPADCVAANLQGHVARALPDTAGEGGSRIFQRLMRAAPGWADVDWLLAESPLPVWVKGVASPDDALALRSRGVAGLVVSNHGGRSIDGAAPSLRLLPAVRHAVGAGFPLLMDGGIRSGCDAFKALALGADAVMLGRLQMYALAAGGALGVAHMLKLMREELELCMALSGCAGLADIGPHCLLPARHDGADAVAPARGEPP